MTIIDKDIDTGTFHHVVTETLYYNLISYLQLQLLHNCVLVILHHRTYAKSVHFQGSIPESP